MCPYCGEPYPYVRHTTKRGTVIEYQDSRRHECDGIKAARDEYRADRERAEREAKRKTIWDLYDRAGIPKRYIDVEPDTDEAKRVLDNHGIYMVGKQGTGKTSAACAIAKGVINLTLCDSVRFTTAPDMLTRIKSSFNDSRESELDILAELSTCNVLVLDDLGKGVPRDWSLEKLYQVIDHRYNNLLPMIVTTQYGKGRLGNRLAELGDLETALSIVSRLSEVCETRKFEGADRRIDEEDSAE